MKTFCRNTVSCKRFPDTDGGELTVFENANFGIDKGEFVCIIGHSGCGKSTIMNILAGLDEATEGVVLMNDKEVSDRAWIVVSSFRTIACCHGLRH